MKWSTIWRPGRDGSDSAATRLPGALAGAFPGPVPDGGSPGAQRSGDGSPDGGPPDGGPPGDRPPGARPPAARPADDSPVDGGHQDDGSVPEDDRMLGHGLSPGRRPSGRRAAAGRAGSAPVPTAGLPLVAVCDPRVPAELHALRTRIPGIDAALVGTLDGVVLAHDPTGGDVQAAGLVAAGLLAEGRQSTVTLGRGRFRNAVLWGADGFLAVYACGPEALLLILADPDTNVGSLHVEARASSAAIAALLAGPG